MASAALVVSRREESKAGLSLKNGPREVGFPQDPENPPISRSHIPFKIVARAPPRDLIPCTVQNIARALAKSCCKGERALQTEETHLGKWCQVVKFFFFNIQLSSIFALAARVVYFSHRSNWAIDLLG